MNTILFDRWYNARELSEERGLPIEEAQALLKAVERGEYGSIVIAHLTGPEPYVQGRWLLRVLDEYQARKAVAIEQSKKRAHRNRK